MAIFVNVWFFNYQDIYFSLEHTATLAETSLENDSGKRVLQ